MCADTYRRVSLSEFRLLLDTLTPRYLETGVATLLAATGRIMDANEIVNCLYGPSSAALMYSPKTLVSVAVHRLRKRGMKIVTYPKRGYQYGH